MINNPSFGSLPSVGRTHTMCRLISSYTSLLINFIFSCCIRAIKSDRAGVGKSLRISRIEENMNLMYPSRQNYGLRIKVPIHEKMVNIQAVLDMLLDYIAIPGEHLPRIFHIDLAHEVCIPVPVISLCLYESYFMWYVLWYAT